jgi:hypothetical protein
VVPTSRHVHMYYGYTALDWFDFVLTWIGLAGLVMLIRPPRRLAMVTGRHFRTGRGRFRAGGGGDSAGDASVGGDDEESLRQPEPVGAPVG